MPSVANFPSAVRLAAGHAVGLLLLAADGDGLLELAAVGAGRGGAFAGRRHAAAVAGVGVAPGDRLADRRGGCALVGALRSEEHTSELQSLMRISYAVFCLKKQNN